MHRASRKGAELSMWVSAEHGWEWSHGRPCVRLRVKSESRENLRASALIRWSEKQKLFCDLGISVCSQKCEGKSGSPWSSVMRLHLTKLLGKMASASLLPSKSRA